MVQAQHAKFETGQSSHVMQGNQQRDSRFPLGNVGIFMQLALALVYLYMMYFGYLTMGWLGLAAVSLFFLAALSAPLVYPRLVRSLRKRRRLAASIQHPDRYELDE